MILQNGIIIRKWKSFTNFSGLLKNNAYLNEKPPEYHSAMNVSCSTKVIPPSYYSYILDQKKFRIKLTPTNIL